MPQTVAAELSTEYVEPATNNHSKLQWLKDLFKKRTKEGSSNTGPSERIELPSGYRSSISKKKLDELHLHVSNDGRFVLDQYDQMITPDELESRIDVNAKVIKGSDPQFTVAGVTVTRAEMAQLGIDHDWELQKFVYPGTKNIVSPETVKEKLAKLSVPAFKKAEPEEDKAISIASEENPVRTNAETEQTPVPLVSSPVVASAENEDEKNMKSSSEDTSRTEGAGSRKDGTTSSSPPGNSNPPDKQTTTNRDGSHHPWTMWVVLIMLVAAGIILKYFGYLNQISASLLVVIAGSILIVVGLKQGSRPTVMPRTEETDEQATKAAGALASASMIGKRKKSRLSGRDNFKTPGFVETLVGGLLLSGLGLYWLIVGASWLIAMMQKGMSSAQPVYIIPLILIAFSVILLLIYVKGWKRLVIALLLGASAWLFFTHQPFVKSQKVVNIGEKESAVYLKKIIDLRIDSVNRTKQFADSINNLLQEQWLKREMELKHVRDSARRIDSTLRSEIELDKKLLEDAGANIAVLRANQTLTFHPDRTVTLFIAAFIVIMIIVTVISEMRWIGFLTIAIALVGLAYIVFWWVPGLNVPIQNTPEVVTAPSGWYKDSLRLLDSVDFYKKRWEKDRQINVTQNIPAVSVVDTVNKTVSEKPEVKTEEKKETTKVVEKTVTKKAPGTNRTYKNKHHYPPKTRISYDYDRGWKRKGEKN